MPRVARIIAPSGYIYHILTRGANRQDIFKAEEDYRNYIDIVRSSKEKYRFTLYHSALMANHVHRILETREAGGSLAEGMKGIKVSSGHHYKKT
jgi:putative transposase